MIFVSIMVSKTRLLIKFLFKELHPLPFASDAVQCHCAGVLFQYSQQTSDNAEQRNTLYEGSCQDHCRTDVTGSFWLASDRLNRTFTDLTDTNTGSQSSDTSTYSAKSCGATI
jgi:hypothetical protein